MSRQDVEQFAEWLKEHRVGEVECLVSDMAGIARGKILPTNKFLSGLRNQTLRLPELIFGQMVTGADAETDVLTYQSPDMNLIPDVEVSAHRALVQGSDGAGDLRLHRSARRADHLHAAKRPAARRVAL